MKIEECFFIDSKLKDIQKKYCEFKFEKVKIVIINPNTIE